MDETQETTVILRFRTQEAKSYFLRGLSDSWGESECTFDLPKGVDLDHAPELRVTPFREEYVGDHRGDTTPDEWFWPEEELG